MRSPVKITAVILFVGIAGAFLIFAADRALVERQAAEKSAKSAGFSDASEMSAARDAGVTDPLKWKAEVARRQEAQRQAKAAADKQATEEKARKEESNRKFQIAVQGAIALREMMKNPDSFSLERVTRQSDGSLCYTYRAANSFNAIIPGQAVFSPTQTAISGQAAFPMLWSKYCKGYGQEVENVAFALTYYPRKK